MLTTDNQKGKFLKLRQIWLKMFCAWNLLLVAAIGKSQTKNDTEGEIESHPRTQIYSGDIGSDRINGPLNFAVSFDGQ